jgi:putative nucleotidyltransferase with HDIG domain
MDSDSHGDLREKIDEYIQNMPSLPTSVTKVLEVCNNPQTSAADLNHVISLDPVLVGRVLKLINSAYYGMNQPITNLVRAIIMLGINTVKNLALSTTVVSSLASKRDPLGLDMEGFWRHSLCVGVTAKLLAKKRGIDTKMLEEYFTAGLLHDIGKIPLNAVLSKGYMLTLRAADHDRLPLFEDEEKNLGMNHCGAGTEIVRAWKLDGPVGDAIIHHHKYDDYAGENGDVLYSVIAAHHFACLHRIGFAGDIHPVMVEKPAWDALGVSYEAFDEFEPAVNVEIEKAKIFLKL